MEQQPPYYLQNFQQDCSNHPRFESGEFLYRRSLKPEPSDHFSTLSTDELFNGLSVNWSKLCPNPSDVLWAPSTDQNNADVFDQNGNHQYTLKETHSILVCKTGNILTPEPAIPDGISLELVYDPVSHNLAHSLIKAIKKRDLTKLEKKSLRLYVASLFTKMARY